MVLHFIHLLFIAFVIIIYREINIVNKKIVDLDIFY
nr:MAG TPA: hypothetical protein [Caudoviricetes sp.]